MQAQNEHGGKAWRGSCPPWAADLVTGCTSAPLRIIGGETQPEESGGEVHPCLP